MAFLVHNNLILIRNKTEWKYKKNRELLNFLNFYLCEWQLSRPPNKLDLSLYTKFLTWNFIIFSDVSQQHNSFCRIMGYPTSTTMESFHYLMANRLREVHDFPFQLMPMLCNISRLADGNYIEAEQIIIQGKLLKFIKRKKNKLTFLFYSICLFCLSSTARDIFNEFCRLHNTSK